MSTWLFANRFLATKLPLVDRALLALGKQLTSAFTTAIDPLPNVAAFAGLASRVSGWPDGVKKYVESVRDNFTLTRTPAAIATDGITVVAAGPANTYWLRDCIPASFWKRQASWFVNPAAGDDEASGIDTTHAIMTLAEWHRRVGDVEFDQAVTVVSSTDATDPLPSPLRTIEPARLVIQGVQAPGETGVISGYVPADPAAATGGDPAVLSKAAGDWSAHVGKLVQITESGGWLRIMKDLGGGDAWVTTCYSVDDVFDFVGSLQVPAIGQHYTVYAPSEVYVRPAFRTDLAGSRHQERSRFECNRNGIVLADCVLRTEVLGEIYMQSSAANVMLMRVDASIHGEQGLAMDGPSTLMLCRTGTLVDSYCNLGISPCNENTQLQHLLCLGSPDGTGNLLIDSNLVTTIRDVYCEGIGVRMFHGMLRLYNNLCVCDYAGDAVWVENGARIASENGSYTFGHGSTGVFLRLLPKCAFFEFRVDHNFGKGAAGEISVGGAAVLIPGIESAGGGALPAAAPCVTWASVNGPPFNGRVFNMENGAFIGEDQV